MGKRIEYQTGEIIGPHGLKYIQEAESYVRPDGKRPVRQAIFECPHCKEHKHFITRICYAKNGHTKSCGCLGIQKNIETIQKYNLSEHEIWNRKSLLKGDIVGDNGVIYIKDIEPYHSPTTGRPYRKCLFICPICNREFESLLGNVSTNKVKGCGIHNSYGEEKLDKILSKMNISFERQKKYKDLYGQNSSYPYAFDFYLPDYNCCIEYDGIQHFEYRKNSCWNNKQNFIDTQRRDKEKNQYCKENNINLIRIPYTDFNKLNQKYITNILEGLNENCSTKKK